MKDSSAIIFTISTKRERLLEIKANGDGLFDGIFDG